MLYTFIYTKIKSQNINIYTEIKIEKISIDSLFSAYLKCT